MAFRQSDDKEVISCSDTSTCTSDYNSCSSDDEALVVCKSKKDAVIIVDPFSTGAFLADGVTKRGYACIRVLSQMDNPIADHIMDGLTLKFEHTIQHNDRILQDKALELTLDQVIDLPYNIAAIIAGAETGVELAEKMSHRMSLPLNNGDKLTDVRRNKFLMGERVKQCGTRASIQTFATSHEDIDRFYDEWKAADPNRPYLVVVKPLESAGSDDIFKCSTPSQTKEAFNKINKKVNGLGIVNEGALVQEYLHGTEFVVDCVSRNGLHKAVAIWEYDKRSVNGADFIYFGTFLRDCGSSGSSTEMKQLVQYSFAVLDALGIANGPSHMEVKMVPDYNAKGEITGHHPCLVEVGARCHGGEGTFIEIADPCLGYNQAGATLDCYLDPDAFDRLPAYPCHLRKHGCNVDLVSYHANKAVKNVPGVEKIRKMDSYRGLALFQGKPGARVVPTVNFLTQLGSVLLIHEDEGRLAGDYQKIRELEHDGFFTFE